MGAWKNAVFLQEKAMSIKFLVLGWGYLGFFWGGGGSADFIFHGREDFSDFSWFQLLHGSLCRFLRKKLQERGGFNSWLQCWA